MQKPRILKSKKKKLIGMRMDTSIANNKTTTLWQQFMPRRKEIKNTSGSDLYAVQIYNSNFEVETFTPETTFENWAAVEVKNFKDIPKGMESLTLNGGTYAVFVHKGAASDFDKTSHFIYGTWLPESDYELDDREHFEIMGDKYLGVNNPDSEEEVWVPVKKLK